MKIVEELDNNIIKVMFYNGGLYPDTYYITTKGKTEDEIFSEKLALVERLSSESHKFIHSRKGILKAYKDVDSSFEEIYNKDYSEKVSDYNYSLTKDEKDFLDECLEYYKRRN